MSVGQLAILIDMHDQPDPLPHGLEHIEGIAERLRGVLIELQDANRANYPPGAWHPGPLQRRFMRAIDGLMDAELELLQVLAEMRDEQRRRLGRAT
jgi:hypothetical protein